MENQAVKPLNNTSHESLRAYSSEEKLELYMQCRDVLKELRQNLARDFLTMGKWCDLVDVHELWKLADHPSFRSWIADPDEGPGIKYGMARLCIRAARCVAQLQTMGIAEERLIAIGIYKLGIVLSTLERLIEEKDLEGIELVLHSALRLSVSDLRMQSHPSITVRGTGDFVIGYDDKGNELMVIANPEFRNKDGRTKLASTKVSFLLKQEIPDGTIPATLEQDNKQ